MDNSIAVRDTIYNNGIVRKLNINFIGNIVMVKLYKVLKTDKRVKKVKVSFPKLATLGTNRDLDLCNDQRLSVKTKRKKENKCFVVDVINNKNINCERTLNRRRKNENQITTYKCKKKFTNFSTQ